MLTDTGVAGAAFFSVLAAQQRYGSTCNTGLL